MASQIHRARLSVTSLEDRTVPAGGDVFFTAIPGKHPTDPSTVVLIGDPAGNDVTVTVDNAGMCSIAGNNGTTIGGNPSISAQIGLGGNILALFQGGDDKVTVNATGGLPVSKFYVSMGSGSDKLSVTGLQGDDFVATQGSVDVFNTQGQVDVTKAYALYAKFKGGKSVVTGEADETGADTVTLDSVSFRKLGVNTGGGADIVTTTNLSAGVPNKGGDGVHITSFDENDYFSIGIGPLGVYGDVVITDTEGSAGNSVFVSGSGTGGIRNRITGNVFVYSPGTNASALWFDTLAIDGNLFALVGSHSTPGAADPSGINLSHVSVRGGAGLVGGDGDDQVKVDACSLGQLAYEGQGGTNQFTLKGQSTVTASATLNGGVGDDTFTVAGAVCGDLAIRTGPARGNPQGKDTVNLAGGTVDGTQDLIQGNLTIDGTKSALCNIGIVNTGVGHNTKLSTGGGADSVLIDASFFIGNVKVLTGAGKDLVAVGSFSNNVTTVFLKGLTLQTGVDQDSVYLSNGPQPGDIELYGGFLWSDYQKNSDLYVKNPGCHIH